MGTKFQSFKIISLLATLIILIFFSSFYCLSMMDKIQNFVNETGLNWMPSVQSFSRMNLYLGNLSRRNLLIITNSIANQNEKSPLNLKDIEKFKTQLEQEIKNYTQLIVPGEQPYYNDLIKNYNEYLESLNFELHFAQQGKGIEALKHYNEIGKPTLFRFTDSITKESAFNAQGGNQSLKQSATLASLTNLIMVFIIIFSITISLLIINQVFKSKILLKK